MNGAIDEIVASLWKSAVNRSQHQPATRKRDAPPVQGKPFDDEASARRRLWYAPLISGEVRQEALPLLKEELARVYSAWASQFDPKRTSNFNGVGRGPSQRPDPRKSISFGPEPAAIRFRVDLSSVAKAIAFAATFDGKIDACGDDG